MEAMGWKRALVVAPHLDDAELGCGGTIARLLDQGSTVRLVTLSAEEPYVEGVTSADLQAAGERARALLQLDRPGRLLHEYRPIAQLRQFSEQQYAILQLCCGLAEFGPQVVFCPALHDNHQDHHAVAWACCRAFKRAALMGFDFVWNTLGGHEPTYFVGLDKIHLIAKEEAVAAYAPVRPKRSYLERRAVHSLAVVRGLQGGSRYAEAFHNIRYVQE